MKVYKFWPPYQANGNTTFPQTQQKSGVYIIKESGKIVYIGFSRTNLYRTMYRHFQKWNHAGQDVVTYHSKLTRHAYTCRVVLCTPTQAQRLERALILKYNPRDNREKYKYYKQGPADTKIVQQYENEFAITEAAF